MAKSEQSFNKKEKEKKRLKKRELKMKKKEERKANATGGDMMMYVDQYGNLTETPPDPAEKVIIDAESIEIGIPKKVEEDIDPVHKGRVAFFNDSKGFGFINDADNGEKYFVHVNGLLQEIKENDKVQFELERGMKGMNAVKVKKI
ncbi:cold-shock protein [Flavicella sp.]|uniref:cold-shock protein n=1 Tax=Flavicella sp. TaxID=2957742 RepID=UPI002606511F|nr:cold shock domain-containing protein [Flavicella sp.]MDG1805718.1 cold shock domain-containing protein [Flavicella sp.]MDG2280751.1 cold shock domain-containing protein [Flavicella sp.]